MKIKHFSWFWFFNILPQICKLQTAALETILITCFISSLMRECLLTSVDGYRMNITKSSVTVRATCKCLWYTFNKYFHISSHCWQKSTILSFNPNQPGLFWRLSCPPSDLGRGSRDRRENLHKDRVRCKLQDCIVRLFFIIIFYSLWINYANLCTKSYFHYKSLIKASRLLIFDTCILFNILSNCALKNFSIEINFLCILLFYEFLMYFFVFSTFFFHCFSLKFVAATFSSII